MRKAPNFSETFRYLYNNQIIKTMTNLQEIWKDIPGYEGIFQASNLGRIKSLSRLSKNRWGQYSREEKIIKPTPDRKGYLKTRLFVSEDNFKSLRVHRLICLAFYGPAPNGMDQVNHKNGIKDDNRVENLEWANNSINQIHAFANGLNKAKFGGENHFSKKVLDKIYGIIHPCAKDIYKALNPNCSYEKFCRDIRNGDGQYEYI